MDVDALEPKVQAFPHQLDEALTAAVGEEEEIGEEGEEGEEEGEEEEEEEEDEEREEVGEERGDDT